jgi:hypothetical protein
MSASRLAEIQKAVERAGNCKATHGESVPVLEVFRGQTVWEGVVEAYDLIGHPKATCAYGWAFQDGAETRFIAVLEIPPVDSPNTAVRAAIAAGAQK